MSSRWPPAGGLTLRLGSSAALLQHQQPGVARLLCAATLLCIAGAARPETGLEAEPNETGQSLFVSASGHLIAKKHKHLQHLQPQQHLQPHQHLQVRPVSQADQRQTQADRRHQPESRVRAPAPSNATSRGAYIGGHVVSGYTEPHARTVGATQLLQEASLPVGLATATFSGVLTGVSEELGMTDEHQNTRQGEDESKGTTKKHHHQEGYCEKEIFASSRPCPKTCPFFAEMQHKFCMFRCVKGNECGLMGTVRDATIPDEDELNCRRCDVEGCKQCVAGKPGEDVEERCKKCMPGYFLKDNGTCGSIGDYVFGSILALTSVFSILILVWYVELRMRPITNEEGAAYGLQCRLRCRVLRKARTPGEEGQAVENSFGQEYPLATNLLSCNLAGPGAMCIFRFEFALLVWALMLILVWCALGFAVSTDIFLVGIRQAHTPQQFCAVIRWGRRRQMELVWVKCIWLCIAYVGSVLGALLFGAQQHRLFHVLNSENTTMSNFAAVLHGLPRLSGAERVEERLKSVVQQQTGEQVVGVSVCWNYHHHAAEIMAALEGELGSLEATQAAAHRRSSVRGSKTLDLLTRSSATEEESNGCFRSICDRARHVTLTAWNVALDGHEHAHEHTTEQLLQEMESTDTAFVVFESKGCRDRAVGTARSREIELDGVQVALEAEGHEPESVLWEEFGVTEADHTARMVKAVVITFSTSFAWTVLLYLPYAHYMASFSYANGDEPGRMAETIFATLVTAGNLLICVTAGKYTKSAGFRYIDDEERAYTSLYSFALLLNLVLDMCLTSFLSYRQMVGMGVHTADGRLLKDLTSYQQIFESYPMQKSLGNMVFHYCWPATFFLPFVGEPIVLSWLPLHVGLLFIRSSKQLQGKQAEQVLTLPVMEQTRYADLIFNAILVSFIPFIAPAYILLTYAALVVSHCFVYAYDHWKVLRCVARFHYAGDSVVKFAQKLFAIPCGMFAAGLVFKLNQMSGKTEELGSGVLQGYSLAAAVVGTFLAHVVLHVLLLEKLVPWLGSVQCEEADEAYSECAAHTPCTWFSSNPVHCLRSQHIFGSQPSQGFYVVGKEHLLKKNPDIGAYFEVTARGS